jgi:hypothetical protein
LHNMFQPRTGSSYVRCSLHGGQKLISSNVCVKKYIFLIVWCN